MTTITQKLTTFVAAFALVAAMVMTLAAPAAHAALTDSQIQSILSLLTSFGADQSTIDNVDASLRGETPTGGTSGGGSSASVCPFTWTRSLSSGDTGADVMALQKFLNADSATQLAASGAGSPGNETSYFGSVTAAGVAKFQNKYASEVLAPLGLSAGTGYFGASSRAKANSLCASAPTNGGNNGGGTTAPTGSGLSVSSASQPANSLAPQSASRVPFTKFTVTAGTDGAVQMNSVVVKRTGLGSNAAFDGVVLVDDTGSQLGTAKTFNSNNQATIGESVTIPAGQSRTFTIAGNMASNLSSYAGEAPGISLVAVNSSANVSGSLPITGAYHTINATLTVGTLELDTSSAFAANSPVSQEIGTTGQRVTGFRLTAGSAEDVRLKMVRFNQTGSVSASDIDNVRIMIDGVAYPATVSTDGNYYTALLGSGILIPEGQNVEVYVEYDIVGSNASGRNIVFDVDENTDIYAEGVTYGYGISPAAGSTDPSSLTDGTSNTTETSGNPYIFGNQVTVTGASVTTIQKATSVAAQNVAINVPNQPLGGFTTDLKGEAMTVQSLDIGITTTGGEDAGDLTNVTLVDENGSVVAGPVDGVASGIGTDGYIRFTDAITFPTGMHTYTIRGKLGTDFANGDTIVASTTPNSTYWQNAKGDNTGDTISLPGGAFSMNTMTVKAAALAVTVSSSPVAQNIVAGVQGFTFANYQFDATQSGEDVRFSSMKGELNFANMAANELSSCQLFDGSTALNTGSNVVNPASSVTTGSDVTFTFDESLTVAKGTVKTLALKCNVSSSVSNNDTASWGINDVAGNISVTGTQSSTSVTESVTASAGQTMTVAAGSLVASEDASSPSYAITKAGATEVTNGIINFRASNEDVTLQRIGLQLTNTASSSGSDITKVSLWDGATKVGEAYFTGNSDYATSTLSTPVVIAKDTDKDITVKTDLAPIGTSAVGTQGALIAVDIDTNGTNTQGVGSSGTTINASGSTSFSGVRVFSSYPTLAKLSVPSSALTTGSDVTLYRFSVTASAGGNGIGLSELTVNVATSTGSSVSGTTTVTNLEVYAYTDVNFSSPVSGYTNGQVTPTLAGLVSSGDNTQALSSILQIPAGQTYYFEVLGDTTLTSGTGTFSGSVTTRLSGDAAYPAQAGLMGKETAVDDDANDDFIWSPNATTTSAAAHVDWTNGYFLPGLPSNGTSAETLSK
ncbi:MAG: beta strand repeat-containing protein [Patescibacteria group bacterium UBA2163]